MAKKDLKKENIESQELNDDNLDNVSGGRVDFYFGNPFNPDYIPPNYREHDEKPLNIDWDYIKTIDWDKIRRNRRR